MGSITPPPNEVGNNGEPSWLRSVDQANIKFLCGTYIMYLTILICRQFWECGWPMSAPCEVLALIECDIIIYKSAQCYKRTRFKCSKSYMNKVISEPCLHGNKSSEGREGWKLSGWGDESSNQQQLRTSRATLPYVLNQRGFNIVLY